MATVEACFDGGKGAAAISRHLEQFPAIKEYEHVLTTIWPFLSLREGIETPNIIIRLNVNAGVCSDRALLRRAEKAAQASLVPATCICKRGDARGDATHISDGGGHGATAIYDVLLPLESPLPF